MSCTPNNIVHDLFDMSFILINRRFSNGNRQCTNGVRIRSECQYTCIPGYHLKGRTMIECLKTSGNEGKWSGDEPTCRGEYYSASVNKQGIENM